MTVYLWTDGACRSSGLGGWACIAVKDERELWRISGMAEETTNNRMELMGIIQGLALCLGISDNVIVKTDSKYSRDALMRKWSDKPLTKNADLIKQGKSLMRSGTYIQWVKGHAGYKWNELADKLATAARDGKTLA